MTRKRKNPLKCPFCGGGAHMVEVVNGRLCATYYAVVCDNESCRMSEPPLLRNCFKTEDEATEAWNRRA